MKDLNKEIICRMEEIKATPKRYLAVLAAFHVAAGLHSIGDAPNGYTRGDFKRAIRTIKEAVNDGTAKTGLGGAVDLSEQGGSGGGSGRHRQDRTKLFE